MPEGDKPGRDGHWAPGLELLDDSTPALALDLQNRLGELASALIPALALHPEVEVCIRVVNLDEMTRLHAQWMGEAKATDVLSFPMDELRPCPPGAAAQPGILGDLVICPDYVAAEGHESVPERLELLVVHGMLHLIGLDHAEEDEQRRMFELQDELLRRWRQGGELVSSDALPPVLMWGVHESG